MNYKLNEGLKVGDLEDIISPVLSIDEYESKIDPDAIVVAFKSFSAIPNPMDDLSEFIETGRNEVLDTEVSVGPDDKGHYILFVELTRGDDFPDNLQTVLDSIKSLSLIKKWKYTYYGGNKKIKDLTMENLKNDLRLEKKDRDVTPDIIKEKVNFFKNSDLDDVRFTADNYICFEKNGRIDVRQSIALGDPTMILEALNLRVAPIQLDTQSLLECRTLRGFLGNNWEVTKIQNHFVLANSDDERVMIIK